jgi:L,D-peptidoglycan transpeptidase YkuD (ErfK/YbiS/YcfS/YnhG family)
MIIVRHNTLTYNDKSFQCAIGKNGITKSKVEGDGCTPLGKYSIDNVYYRKDRVHFINVNFTAIPILENYGWCDDIESEYYNKFITFPFSQSAEKLYRDDSIYDILCVINYNQCPVIKNKGSAIFLHIANQDYSGTEGCLAIKKEDLIFLLSRINQNTEINIIS